MTAGTETTTAHRLAGSPVSIVEAGRLVKSFSARAGLEIYQRSITISGEAIYFLARRDHDKVIGVLGKAKGFSGDVQPLSGEAKGVRLEDRPPDPRARRQLQICPTSHQNLEALRRELPFLRPRPLGLALSIGMGDRLGLATPGHVRAVRHSNMAPIFAQQSVRENARIGRTPQAVLNDATLGVFQEGWQAGYGADADHVKTTADLDVFVDAGYTFFTIDPSDQIDNRALAVAASEIQRLYTALPWDELETSAGDTLRRYTRAPIKLDDLHLALSAEQVQRAAVKYGRVIVHAKELIRHITSRLPSESAESAGQYEVELSIDETDQSTSVAEHYFIASELRRLGAHIISLAPRYVGRFEKGVDFIGDPAAFATAFGQHLTIARTLGPYKLSLHSGSDKFTLYPIIARAASDGLFHLKTAGTSYLEALRTIATVDPELFREIMALAHSRFEDDRATYHVSARRDKAPDSTAIADRQLPDLLDDFHVRQILHVTFGSILRHGELKAALLSKLRDHESVYHQMLQDHFEKHTLAFPRSS